MQGLVKEMGAAEVTILLLFYIKWRNPKLRTVILVGRVKNLSEEGEGKKKLVEVAETLSDKEIRRSRW